MKNLGQMMKQAKEMQEKMGEIQARIEETEVTGEAGGGMVQVTLNGKGAMRRLRLDPNSFRATTSRSWRISSWPLTTMPRPRSRRLSAGMGQLTGGLNLPAGFNLPF